MDFNFCCFKTLYISKKYIIPWSYLKNVYQYNSEYICCKSFHRNCNTVNTITFVGRLFFSTEHSHSGNIFINHLLCAQYCSRPLGMMSEQNKDPFLLWSLRKWCRRRLLIFTGCLRAQSVCVQGMFVYLRVSKL